MKKLIILLMLALLVSCQTPATQEEPKGNTTSQETQKTEKPANTAETTTAKKVVTATTPFIADMVQIIAGDTVEIETIMPIGEDPHLYVALPGDYDKLDKADLVLYHGLHFEGKMVDVLEEKGHAVTAKFDPKDLIQMEEDGEKVTDPHFWFDINLYKQAVAEASRLLQELNPEHKELYEKNTADYHAKLDELQTWATNELNQIPKERRILITPHDAFGYFGKNFDIQVAAPQGVSTDSEVSNKDVIETINFIVENQIKAVFTETTTDPARMQKLQEGAKEQGFELTVVSNEDEQLLADSLAPKDTFGDTFIDMVKHNVNTIVKYLK